MIKMTATTSSLSLIALDAIWLYVFMGRRFTSMVERIQQKPTKIRVWAMVGAYALMVLGHLLFVLPQVTDDKSALRTGFVFGVILYGVFELTNAAVFQDWDLRVAFVDIAWGGFVFAVAAWLFSLSNHTGSGSVPT